MGMVFIYYLIIPLVFTGCKEVVHNGILLPDRSLRKFSIDDTLWKANEGRLVVSGFKRYLAEVNGIVCVTSSGELYIQYVDHSPTKNFVFRQEIGKESGSGIVQGVVVHNIDSIFLFREEGVSLIDTLGVKWTYPLDKIRKGRHKFGINFLENSEPWFDQRTSRLYFPVYCFNCSPVKKAFYSSPVLAFLDIVESKFGFVPCHFPENYFHHYYGFMDHYSTTWNGSTVYFSFNATPDIIGYNIDSQIERKCHSRSRFQVDDIATLSKRSVSKVQEKANHMIYNEMYLGIMYDPFRRLYYRVFSEKLEIVDKDQNYNDFEDRKYILMIFDEDFNLLTEYRLEDCHCFGWFISGDGLYLPLKISVNPTRDTFRKLNVNVY